MQRPNPRVVALVVFETALILGAIVLAVYVRSGSRAGIVILQEHALAKGLVIAFICQVCLYFSDLYDLRLISDRRELFVRTVQALGVTSLVLATLYFWFPDLIIGRGVFAIAVTFVISAVTGWRLAFEWLVGRVRPRERVLLVGTGAAAVSLAKELHSRRELGVEIVGFVDSDPALVGTRLFNPGVIGTIDDIPDIVRSAVVDRVVISLADARGRLPMDRLLDMKLRGVAFDHLASLYEKYTGKIAVENLRPSWLLFADGFHNKRLVLHLKRAFDVAASLFGLLLALPLMAAAAIAIRATSRGPVFYHQQRVGQNGVVFTVHKFRSMRVDAEAASGAVWARPDDDRVTRVGRWMRLTRVDELPQLWNVLVGEMSFVGPRPERPEFVGTLTRDIPFYGQRHVVKPGVTGWAQVSYSYGASVEDALQKLQYDLYYIKNTSLALDLFIMLKTVKVVLLRRGAA